MAQKAKPEERTILQALAELAGYEDIRTSEDIPPLSESSIFSDWVLPAVTGASAETEEYKPGLLELALTIPVVGGSIKTGFKLAKKGAKKLSEAYKRSIRPKVLPQKDELLRLRETQFPDVSEMDEILSGLEQQMSMFQGAPSATRAVAQTSVRAVRTAEQSIQHIVTETQGMIRGGIGGGDLTYRQAKAIYRDIGEQGFREFKEDILSMPQDARELAVDNFMAKYKVSVSSLSGPEGVVAYKQSRFTSRMPDQVIKTSKGSASLEIKTSRTSGTTSHISIEIEPTDLSRRKKGSASINFSIKKVTDAAGKTFDVVSDIHYYAHGTSIRSKTRYAGLIMHELLKKVPKGTIIDESILSYDALYILIRTAIKTNSKIIFQNPKLAERFRQVSSLGEMSPITLLYNKAVKTGNPNVIDNAVDKVMVILGDMIEQARSKGLVEGIPEFRKGGVIAGSISYNAISVEKLGALVAGAFGFKNREELMKFLSYDPDSTEAQVFDNEFSL